MTTRITSTQVYADSITDAAGSGTPNFPNGATLKGRTSGAAITAGNIGEVLSTSSTSTFSGGPTLNTIRDSISLSVTAGVFMLSASGYIEISGYNGTGTLAAILYITDNSNNIIASSLSILSNTAQNLSGDTLNVTVPINISSTTTYKVRWQVQIYSGTGTVSGSSIGSTVPPTTLYATRIA